MIRSTDALPRQGKEKYQRTADAIQQSVKARANVKRTLSERLADEMTAGFGSMPFLIANCVWFVVWIAANTGLVHGLPEFDPFPFGLLTMIVSLEAIILAIVVLISQNQLRHASPTCVKKLRCRWRRSANGR